MDIEKLMNEPDLFFSGVTARITEQAIEFENRCIGEALSMWQIRKEDVLKRIHEADKLQAENEKLRAELEQVKRERDKSESFLGELEGAVYTGQYFHLRPMIEKWRGQED